MASTHKSLRSGTANKRPTTSIAEGQIALNTNTTSPGLFFKDSTGATIIKVGPVHVGTTAPNATPASGGSAGNSTGEVWLDNSLTPYGIKIWDGAAWQNATPSGSTTVQGLLELATSAETQTGSDTARAVTPAGLQSKVSDSTSTTSSTTIASSTAVKSAYDLAAAAVPLSGGTVTGNLEIGTTGSLSFEGATADGFETTIAVVDPTADRTITLPDTTGTVVLDSGAQTVQFGLGASATPSVTFTGDTNTGIYSPGADQVAISTGGSGRLFVDASGNVGVGQTPKTWGLLGAGRSSGFPSASIANLDNNSGNYQLQLLLNAYRDGSGTYRYLKSSGVASQYTQDNNSNHVWYTAPSGTAEGVITFSERLRITSAGLVGIGTSSPNSLLHVLGGSANIGLYNGTTDNGADRGLTITTNRTSGSGEVKPFLEFFSARSYASSSVGQGRFYYNWSTGLVFENGTGSIGSSTITPGAYTSRFCISPAGDVGIGTTSPEQLLDVRGVVQIKNAGTCTLRFNDSTTNYWDIQNDSNLRFSRGGSEYARIDSSGRLGIGTASPDTTLYVAGTQTVNERTIYKQADNTTNVGSVGRSSIFITGGGTNDMGISSADALLFAVNGSTEAARIDSSGRLGIGTASPARSLQVTGANSGEAALFRLENNQASGGLTTQAISIEGVLDYNNGGSTAAAGKLVFGKEGTYTTTTSTINSYLAFHTVAANTQSERARIDSSGRLLVGTSTARAVFNNSTATAALQIEGATANTANISITRTSADTGPSIITFAKSRGSVGGTPTVVASNDLIGFIAFEGADGTEFVRGASIAAEVDGTPGANDMPGRLVFSTTADGASSPTERLRIGSDGLALIGKAASNITSPGTEIGSGAIWTTRTASTAMRVNRLTDDGTLVEFLQASVAEGTISVSGTTVSYNGAHLSRWSQLPSGAEREEILRGTVLSNIDEMCEWGEEENEQLNRMKVSDVEGDKNVSGVFQAWDDDDDTYINDFYCAMTGDFIIRIGADTTVERGDLLMSAGDGTAKPQDDDIIRSKTIAKVTSTHVSCTYEDGSYCVPCVLMAC